MREKLLHDVAREFLKYEIPVSVKQEILQNTMDRYDDYIAQGYTEDDAYHFAKECVGDLHEIEAEERAKRPSFKKLIYSCIGAMVVIMVIIYVCMRLFTVVAQPGPHGFGSGPAVESADYAVIEGETMYDASQIENISIGWASGSITVEAGNTDKIEFFENRGSVGKPMVASLNGRTLKIDFCEKGLNIINIGSKDLTVIVPTDWTAGELNIDYASAKVNVVGITADKITADGASGSCELKEVTARSVNADTASGEIRVDGSNIGSLNVDSASGKICVLSSAVSEFDADTASGAVDVQFVNVPGKISADTASGAVSIGLPAGAGFTAEFDSASGKFKSNVSFDKKGSTYTYGFGECEIEVDTASGSLTVNVG